MGVKDLLCKQAPEPEFKPPEFIWNWRLEQMHTCDSSAPVTLILVNMHTYVPVLVNMHTCDSSVSYDAHLWL